MKQTILAAMFIALASPSYAFELQTLKSANISATELTLPAPTPAPVVSAEKQYQNLWMSVYANPSFKESAANDYSARIEVRVRKVFDTMFDVNARVDMNDEGISINKFGNNFNLSGFGANLSMSEWNGNYNISGSVSAENNQTTFVNLTLFKGSDNYSFNVSGFGLNMSVSRSSISGSYENSEYSKKAVAAVVALALAAQVDKMPAQKDETKAGERIWLSIRPSMGWYLVEASDPFADIEVGLRKGFVEKYDVDITVGSERESGTVANFFSRTYEYNGNRTSLKLEGWGGSYKLEGELYVKGQTPEMMKIKMNVRDTFGGGAFSISENGLRLMIDRNGVNGEVDTKVYPKKLVAVITALALAVQQEFPRSGK